MILGCEESHQLRKHIIAAPEQVTPSVRNFLDRARTPTNPYLKQCTERLRGAKIVEGPPCASKLQGYDFPWVLGNRRAGQEGDGLLVGCPTEKLVVIITSRIWAKPFQDPSMPMDAGHVNGTGTFVLVTLNIPVAQVAQAGNQSMRISTCPKA
jgi:hypothetical protein